MLEVIRYKIVTSLGYSEGEATAPRTKRHRSKPNQKSVVFDYGLSSLSLFVPVLNFFHAHRVSAKELRSNSLNLLAIRHKCRTEIRSARLAEEA